MRGPLKHERMKTIRPANLEDLESVIAIVQNATRHMNDQGMYQWDDIYPNRTILQNDIENHHM